MTASKKKTVLSHYTANEKWRHISAYVPHELFGEIDRRAKDSRRSISAQIIVMLEACVKAK